VDQPDIGGGRRPAGPSTRAERVRGRVILWALGAAAASAVAVWLLMPRTPDAFSTVGAALQAGPGSAASTTGLPVFTYYGPTSSTPGPAPSMPAPVTTAPIPLPTTQVPAIVPPSPSQHPPSSAWVSSSGTRSSRPSVAALLAPRSGSGQAGPPIATIGRDVAKAHSYSSTVAVEFGRNNSLAVAPVVDTAGRGAVAVLLAAALITALASLGGAMLGRCRNYATLQQAGTGVAVLPPSPAPAPGMEQIASRELRRLRDSSQQKTALARNLAELVPSMPEALVWQAEQALAEVGVRQIVPDGEPFDAAVHHAVGTEPVPRGGRENTVSRTIRPGYADDTGILVFPKVIVYADDADRRTG